MIGQRYAQVVGTAVVVTLVLAACGGGTPAAAPTGAQPTAAAAQSTAPPATSQPPAGGSGAGACGLASREEVTAALGQSIVSQDESSDAESTTCRYFSATDPVLVLSYSPRAPEEAQSMLQDFRAEYAHQAVEGVGDEAYYADCFMFVWKGAALASITFFHDCGPLSPDAVQLAALIASRM